MVAGELQKTYTFLDSSLEIAFRALSTFSTMANLHLLRGNLIFRKSRVSSEPKVVSQVVIKVGNPTCLKNCDYKGVKLIFL